MNVPNLDFIGAPDDRARLVGFLHWLGQFLEELVKESLQGRDTKLFDPDMTDDLRKSIDAAWREIREKEIVERAAKAQSEVPQQALEENGLAGAQLSLKLRFLRWIADKFSSHPSSGLLRRLLKSIDNLLGSLAEGNVIAHALKEFKEVLESLAYEH